MSSRRSFLDETDKEILKLVQLDAGRPSQSKLAQKLGISKAKVNYRLNRLEKEGIIEGYHAKVNPAKLTPGAKEQ